jgi:hypothetical protein
MTAQGMPTVPWNERRDSEQRLLKAQLRRAERWRQIKAALLVAPLLLFLRNRSHPPMNLQCIDL